MDGSSHAPKIDNAATSTAAPARAMRPVGLNHLVLNVRDQAESHRFWTEILGFEQVGELKATPTRPNPHLLSVRLTTDRLRPDGAVTLPHARMADCCT